MRIVEERGCCGRIGDTDRNEMSNYFLLLLLLTLFPVVEMCFKPSRGKRVMYGVHIRTVPHQWKLCQNHF